MKMLVWSICNLCAHVESKEPHFRNELTFHEAFNRCPKCGTKDVRSTFARQQPNLLVDDAQMRHEAQDRIIRSLCRRIRSGHYKAAYEPDLVLTISIDGDRTAHWYCSDDYADSIYLYSGGNSTLKIAPTKTQSRNLMCAYGEKNSVVEFQKTQEQIISLAALLDGQDASCKEQP